TRKEAKSAKDFNKKAKENKEYIKDLRKQRERRLCYITIFAPFVFLSTLKQNPLRSLLPSASLREIP
ncbi:hypothetical protein, partial [Chitinophaga terrae (ex Kim and Jung 2007)]|uniref:hypothetical protein n=1 Tax=Chitinophaga terrae (ex Kim and Jung 2007) TaxID=408074 RepID=UPI001B3C82AD